MIDHDVRILLVSVNKDNVGTLKHFDVKGVEILEISAAEPPERILRYLEDFDFDMVFILGSAPIIAKAIKATGILTVNMATSATGNEIVYQAMQDIAGLILRPGIINIDLLEDIKFIMKEDTTSTVIGIGTGSGNGEHRMETAAKNALMYPLMPRFKRVDGIIFNIESNQGTNLSEIIKAANVISEIAHENTQIIWGHSMNEDVADTSVRITIIAKGCQA